MHEQSKLKGKHSCCLLMGSPLQLKNRRGGEGRGGQRRTGGKGTEAKEGKAGREKTSRKRGLGGEKGKRPSYVRGGEGRGGQRQVVVVVVVAQGEAAGGGPLEGDGRAGGRG